MDTPGKTLEMLNEFVDTRYSTKENFDLGTLLLDITNSAATNLVTEKGKEIHSSILETVKKIISSGDSPYCDQCTTQNASPCGNGNAWCRFRPHMCQYHDFTDPAKESRQCPKGICTQIAEEIINLHRFGKPSFKNTDARKWCVDPEEILKCFTKDAYTARDLSANMNIMENCMVFCGKDSCEQVREKRNNMFHLSKLRTTNQELREMADVFLNFADTNMSKEDATEMRQTIERKLRSNGFIDKKLDEIVGNMMAIAKAGGIGCLLHAFFSWINDKGMEHNEQPSETTDTSSSLLTSYTTEIQSAIAEHVYGITSETESKAADPKLTEPTLCGPAETVEILLVHGKNASTGRAFEISTANSTIQDIVTEFIQPTARSITMSMTESEIYKRGMSTTSSGSWTAQLLRFPRFPGS
ncbi:hypothetical protein MAR_021865 [Mya arenaria]|uniref:Uncharacterized protein n=1 Tax=Mya arenaria TaxID=6604 RepID=A0ABY7ECR5_MYAAR|nr:uncharacterized protein LOC128233718 [Mya arenaria]WAR06496.1 hypothetical protein MAR_021865 [Mya arenaria]